MQLCQRLTQLFFLMILAGSVASSQELSPSRRNNSSSSDSRGSSPSDPRFESLSPDVWRAEKRLIDLHQHVESDPKKVQRAVGILDRAGVGI